MERPLTLDEANLYAHSLNHYASLGSWAARWAKVVEAAVKLLDADTNGTIGEEFRAEEEIKDAVRAALKESPHAD